MRTGIKKHLELAASALGLALLSESVFAADSSDCELLLVQIIEREDGLGEARIPSYIPAEAFFETLNDDAPEHLTEYAGHPIQAIMCQRDDIIPAEADHAILETGIPFILSQDFDSSDTDSLTLYWKDGEVQHVYKGYPLSEEATFILETRLAAFSEQGLSDWTRKMAAKKQDEKAEDETAKPSETEEETDLDAETETENTVPETGRAELENEVEIAADAVIETNANIDDVVETESVE